jgi:anti-anti-sigma factor
MEEMQKDRFCDIKIDGDALDVRFKREFLYEQPHLHMDFDEIDELVEKAESPQITVNMAGVVYISSVSLGWFFELAKNVRQKSGHMKIVNSKKPIFESFTVVRLDNLVEIEKPAE